MIRTAAFILNRYNVREADRFFVAYTSQLGKVRAFAKSTRRPLSKLAPHLEPGILTELIMVRGKNGWQLIGAHNLESFLLLRNNHHKLTIALQAARLVDIITREAVPDQIFFKLLYHLHLALNSCECQSETELTLHGVMFQWQALKIIGVQPRLGICLECHKALSEEITWLTSERAGVLCDSCVDRDSLAVRLTPVNRQWLQWLLDHSLDELEGVQVPEEQQHELAFLVQSFLQYQTEKAVSRPWVVAA